MTFAALDSALLGPLFTTAAMRSVFSDRARLAAMLKAEAALARATAKHGLAPKALAAAIGRIRAEDLDLAALGAKTADAGVVTIPFVKALETKLPEKLRGDLHLGASSQDIVDTATALQMRQGLDLIEGDLRAIMRGLARLARTHRRTPMVGRSYGQHAAPVSFGFVVAGWLTVIGEVAAGCSRIRRRALAASLGGPVGTLAALGPKGPAVLEAFAAELGLEVPAIAWHTNRVRIAETGAWLAMLIGALAKLATDVVHLCSTEVGEVSEPHSADRGGSSAMPHKRNPVSSTVILAAHGAAAGLAGTLIGSMAALDQRPAGAWHAEWHALPQLFGLASGALREARSLAEGLVVHPERMRANLDLTRGLLFSDAVAAALVPEFTREAAHRIVAKAADAVRTTGATLQEVVGGEPAIPVGARKAVAAAFGIDRSLDAAAAMTDRALAEVGSFGKKR
jgi:3-carboxy-cis,cis-muconate cycloisomerase